MKNLSVLEFIKEILEKSIEKILEDMLETSTSNDSSEEPKVKNWKPLAALEAYLRLPIGFDPAKTDEKIYEEYKNENKVSRKKEQILCELKKRNIFVDWGKRNAGVKNFTAVTVIDGKSHRLIGPWGKCYDFKSIDEALSYIECFKKFYRELMKLAEAKRGALLPANKLEITIKVLTEELIKAGSTDIEDD